MGPIPKLTEVGVIGAGIIGLATARALLHKLPGLRVTVLEKESTVAAHQSSHNSGVVHAGIYYEPGSLKAELCVRGRVMLRDFCQENKLPYQEVGKLIVANRGIDEARLQTLFARGIANGVPELRLIGEGEMRTLEPSVSGRAAISSPRTAITDFSAISRALASDVEGLGGNVRVGTNVQDIEHGRERVRARTTDEHFDFDHLVVCAGLQADRVAQMSGADPEPSIVPFRGDYRVLNREKEDLVRGLVYPTPDPTLPFLGVHLTKRLDGSLLLGPTALLATAREGYAPTDFSLKDCLEYLRSPGFRKLAARHWRVAVGELRRVLHRRSFAREVQRLVPAVDVGDISPGPSGVRAQALARNGDLLDDFWIDRTGRVTNVRNAPSPGGTSSLAIADLIANAVINADR